MFSNKIVPITEKTIVKISYNDEKCFYCNSYDMIINNGVKNNLSYCKRCNKHVLLAEYITKDKYKKIIDDRISCDNIKKTNFDKFIKSSDI